MFTIREYLDENGKRPFRLWLDKLDRKCQSKILARIARFQDGHFGDHKRIGKSIFEARFFFGPGYRLYFAKLDREIVLLLCGGDKSRQRKDIKMAQVYLRNYLEDENA